MNYKHLLIVGAISLSLLAGCSISFNRTGDDEATIPAEKEGAYELNLDNALKEIELVEE